MACDGHNCYFSFWAISCSFTDQKKMTQSNRPKNQFFEKKKKTTGEIILCMRTKNYDLFIYCS